MANDEPPTEDRLLAETLKSFKQHEKVWPGFEISTAALEPGDVIVPERLQAYEVEWAVVARDVSIPVSAPASSRVNGTGRLLVVPADGSSLVGGSDLAVDSAELGGPWTLHCLQGGWVDEEHLRPWARTGRLTEADARKARERWWQVANGAVVGSTLERELEEDPEYQEWLEEVVLPARRALFTAPEPAVQTAPLQHMPVQSIPVQPTSRIWQGVAVAASLLLVLAGVWIDQLKRASSLANPQKIEVGMDRRSGEASGSFSPGASHVLWVIGLDPEMNAPRFRLELVRTDSGEVIWEEDRLVEGEKDILLAGTPTSKLRAGEYRMRLYSLRDGVEPKLLETRTIHLSEAEEGEP